MFFTKSKRGSLQDLIFIAVVIFFFSIVLLVSYKVTNEFNSHISGMDNIPAEAKTAADTLEGHFPGILNNAFLFLSIGIALVSVALAAMVVVHPIFIPFYFIGLVITIIMSGIWSNVYEEISLHAEFSALSANLVIPATVMSYLPFIVGVFGMIIMVVMYKVWRART